MNKSEIKLKFMINVKFKMHSQTCPIKKTIIKGLNFQIYNNNYIKKKKKTYCEKGNGQAQIMKKMDENR